VLDALRAFGRRHVWRDDQAALVCKELPRAPLLKGLSTLLLVTERAYYGTSFPVVTVRDMVNVQKALADRLGTKKLKAVMGPSMGSMQAVEWASAYPEMVQKIILVIPAGLAASPYLVGSLGTMGEAIRNDPRWTATTTARSRPRRARRRRCG